MVVMKLTKLLSFFMLTAFTFTLSPAAQALLLGQAGDIADGKPYKITATEIASYYKDGKSGSVTFHCYLQGENVNALLYAGKNFVGNLPAFLEVGDNGPYTWYLYDRGDTNGNIKIQLTHGQEAIVQCVQMSA